MSELEKALLDQKRNTEQVNPEIYGSLGIPIDGRKTVDVPNRQSYVYVRLRDNQNEVVQAFNNKVATSYNLPVILEREGNRYKVQGVNTQRYENNWYNSAPYLPNHGVSHSFPEGGGGDIVWVFERQIMPALVYPNTNTGTNVKMFGYPFLAQDDTWRLVGNTGTQELIGYRPITGALSVMALVYLDSITGNPGVLVNSGTQFPQFLTGSQIYPYLPVPSSTQIPLAGVRLSTGTSRISWENIYGVRQPVNAAVREAPIDGQFYARRNAGWEEVSLAFSNNLYFLTSGSAGVSTYDLMTLSRPTGTYNYYSASISATGTMLADWITEPNVPNASFISDGVYHLHVHAQKTGGTKDARLKYIFSHRDSSGMETVLHVSELSGLVQTSETELDIESIEAEHELSTSDRLVVRLYGFQEGGGSAPTVQIKIEGDTLSRFEIPSISTTTPVGAVTIQDEGVDKGTAPTLNFVGGGVDASVSGGVARIFVTGTLSNAPQDYISGLDINYITSGSISVTPGQAYVPSLGRDVIVTGSITQVLPTPLPTGTWQNVYLWENGGVPSIQVTGTAPSNPYKGRARTKLNDSNYRYLGSLLVNNLGYLYRFATTVVGGSLEMTWVENQSVAPFQVTTLSGSTANQTILMAGLLPMGTAGISDQMLVIPTVTAPATTAWQLGFGDEIPDASVLTAENVIRIDNQTAAVVNSFFPPVPTKIPGVNLLLRSSSAAITIGIRVRGIRIPRS